MNYRNILILGIAVVIGLTFIIQREMRVSAREDFLRDCDRYRAELADPNAYRSLEARTAMVASCEEAGR